MANEQQRANDAFKIRRDAAQDQKSLPLPPHPTNNDETLYPNKIGSYSKGLPHNNLGEVDLAAYNLFIAAVTSGKPVDFEEIPRGGARRFVNPQAGLAFEMEGPDSHHLAIPPAPPFAGARQAGEIVENYWMALTRDVHFSSYESDPTIQSAAADLASRSEFSGPKTPKLLFRGTHAGDEKGPYLSQFLLKDVPFGAQTISQKMKTVLPGVDYMTAQPQWLSVQRGEAQGPDAFDPVARYIRNGRDLGQWVHVDALYQAYFNACLILLGAGAPVDDNNPYTAANSKNQDGFGTFGGPHILSLVTEVATRALKAVWFQKWFVHRRLRPEAFAGRIHMRLTNQANYPIHQDALGSAAAAAVHAKYGTYFLPMAFPEGSPLHPAYGAGHATVAGACVTILKAWFKESTKLADIGLAPVVASADGLSLVPYAGADAGELTVGGELNKIASNIAIGRNMAGVHWRTDYTASVVLGEAVAIGILRDHKGTYNESFKGFSLTKFDGSTIVI